METLKLDSSEILKKKIIKNTLEFALSQEGGGLLLNSITNNGKIYQNARSTSCSGGPQID